MLNLKHPAFSVTLNETNKRWIENMGDISTESSSGIVYSKVSILVIILIIIQIIDIILIDRTINFFSLIGYNQLKKIFGQEDENEDEPIPSYISININI